MQNNTIHKIQHVLDTSVKVLKFVWRHALTLTLVGMMLFAAIVIGKIAWKNCFYLFIGATFIDWFKMKWKLSVGSNNYQVSSITSPVFWNQPDWNGRVAGTTGYLGAIGAKYS